MQIYIDGHSGETRVDMVFTTWYKVEPIEKMTIGGADKYFGVSLNTELFGQRLPEEKRKKAISTS